MRVGNVTARSDEMAEGIQNVPGIGSPHDEARLESAQRPQTHGFVGIGRTWWTRRCAA